MRNSLGATAVALMAVSLPLTSATLSINDRLYDAIRNDDRKAVSDILESGTEVNARDGRGTTPLMYAAAAGSAGMMRQLIAAGADVNAATDLGATALLWCANNLEKVRTLVDAGANVNARSKMGRTPLLVASVHEGNLEVVRLLVEKGADLKAKDQGANTPLIQAAQANDTAMARFLLERGADVKAKNAGGFTPLMHAAANGNAELVKLLIARGAEVNTVTAPSFGEPVKNGPIAIGNLTPLLMAVTRGNAETVRILLESGADVNARDVRGMTPVMLAVASDHANEEIVRMLLAKKPPMDVKSKMGETALDWAAKFRHPAILPAILEATPGAEMPKREMPKVEPANAKTAKEAVAKSIALMQKSTVSFFQDGGCISCHSQNITSVAVAAAAAKGIAHDEKAAAEMARATRLQFTPAGEPMMQRLDPPAVEIVNLALFALSSAGVRADRVTDAMVHNVAAQQRADGSWRTVLVVRPPTSDGAFTNTAMSVRAVRDFAPPARRAEMDGRIARALEWIKRAAPENTEDHVMQLFGATWAGADSETLSGMAKRLLALQREDGGWAPTPYLDSDAYSTATALAALHESGMLADSDPRYQNGAAYLMRTQAADGSWHVASRVPKFQPYFESGFPYGHDQWISNWATGWAAVALSNAIPAERAAR